MRYFTNRRGTVKTIEHGYCDSYGYTDSTGYLYSDITSDMVPNISLIEVAAGIVSVCITGFIAFVYLIM